MRAILTPTCSCAAAAGLLLGLLITGCRTPLRPGEIARRTGDEIVVAGQFVHTGTHVVTWLDPGGYDGYRVERRFSKPEEADWEPSKAAVRELTTPNRYGTRRGGLTSNEVEQVRGGGWDLATLRKMVDQFVVHYDACGTSRQCFKVLHDLRGLSVHFLLDLDGTIYQTLDVKERAWHATTSNSRAVGLEIAHPGAYPPGQGGPLREWYRQESSGRTRVVIPARFGDGGLLTSNFVGHAARPGLIAGNIQGRELVQYDFTLEQYQALTRLIAALCQVFPKLQCDYPKDASGKLIAHKLPDADLEHASMVIGHFHIQTNKTDPGPAFQWDTVIKEARELMRQGRFISASSASKGATLLLCPPWQ
jgi:N-acetylmuramoyl-L-alanine amidase